jgi:hypothetical protein
MAGKKKLVAQDSFLNSVARRLGHAAGTLTKATHDLADNVSTLPETISTKVHEVVDTTTVKLTPITKKSRSPRKRTRVTGQAPPTKSRAGIAKRTAKKKAKRSPRSRSSNR